MANAGNSISIDSGCLWILHITVGVHSAKKQKAEPSETLESRISEEIVTRVVIGGQQNVID